MTKTMFFLRRDPWRIGIDLYYGHRRDDGSLEVATDVTMQVIAKGESAPQTPMMELTEEGAQVLMDALWDVGIRPTEGSGSAGSLKATQNHLSDLRSIVAKTLDVKL